MSHKHLSFKAQMMKIIFSLMCLWHPLFVLETEANASQKTDLPSLTLLFDTLNVDRNVAKNTALRIVEELGGHEELMIHNYTLVPFNHESNYQPIITADANSCKAEIQKLKTKATNYNAEPLYPLEKSLTESHPPNPFIIMISDSKPQDDASISGILSAINATKTKLIFLLSRFKISIMETNSNKLYMEMAKASEGKIFNYEDKASVNEAMQFVYQIMNVTAKDPPESERVPKPIPGGWSEWTKLTPCGKDFESFIKKENCQCATRQCNNPYPKYGGKWCEGDYIDVKC